ncbi:MAG: hypothetical protein J07HQW1_00058, partial [Haloquadratum walsbyi J07HQW1]
TFTECMPDQRRERGVTERLGGAWIQTGGEDARPHLPARLVSGRVLLRDTAERVGEIDLCCICSRKCMRPEGHQYEF